MPVTKLYRHELIQNLAMTSSGLLRVPFLPQVRISWCKHEFVINICANETTAIWHVHCYLVVVGAMKAVTSG